MIIMVTAALALLGGTTWLSQTEPTARPALHRRLTAAGLLSCLAVALVAVVAALVMGL